MHVLTFTAVQKTCQQSNSALLSTVLPPLPRWWACRASTFLHLWHKPVPHTVSTDTPQPSFWHNLSSILRKNDMTFTDKFQLGRTEEWPQKILFLNQSSRPLLACYETNGHRHAPPTREGILSYSYQWEKSRANKPSFLVKIDCKPNFFSV